VVEDLYQEFLLFLFLLRDDFKKLRQFRGEKGLTVASWLRVVISRLTIDFLRQQLGPATAALDVSPVPEADSSDILIGEEEKRLLSCANDFFTVSGRLDGCQPNRPVL
jgi:DNA-directed RNA polymerase specialized sigma24 family protein